jgi:hypothetical protein
MLNDQQAHDFLHAAGDEIVVRSLDPHAAIARSRRRRALRVLTVVGVAAAVCLIAAGGYALRLDPGNRGAPLAGPSADGVDPLISTSEWAPGDPYMRAIVGGVLEMSADGCLFVQNGDHRIDLLWPKSFSATNLADGSVVVEDPTGQVAAAVGSPFSASGGYVPVPADMMACWAGPPGSRVAAVQAEIQLGPR